MIDVSDVFEIFIGKAKKSTKQQGVRAIVYAYVKEIAKPALGFRRPGELPVGAVKQEDEVGEEK